MMGSGECRMGCDVVWCFKGVTEGRGVAVLREIEKRKVWAG